MAETAQEAYVQTALKHKWNPPRNMVNDFHQKNSLTKVHPHGPEGPGEISPGPSGPWGWTTTT